MKCNVLGAIDKPEFGGKNLSAIIAAIFMSVLGVCEEVGLSLDFWAETTGKETYEYTEYVFSRLLHQLWFNIRVPMDGQWPSALPV